MRILFTVITLISFSSYLNAQSDSLPDPEVHFSAIIVNDFDISLEWYTSVVGFEIIDKTESKERGFSQANLKRGNALL